MENSSKKNEEIDLMTIFNGIKNLIISIWNFFVNCIQIIFRRWWVFAICLVLGVTGGYGLYKFFRPVYISSLTLSSKILTNEYCADIINDLEDIVSDRTPELLAQKLSIDLATAQEIKKIEFSNFNEKLNRMFEDRDTIVLGIPFKIIVYSYSNKVFNDLEPALVKYLENNKYALKRKAIKKENLEAMREKVQHELIELDTLKKNISANVLPRGNASGFVFGQPIDPMGIYRAGIDLFRSTLNLREEILLIDGIQVVDSFSAREKPDSPKLWKMISACVVMMLFLGLIAAFRMERKKS